MNKTLFLILAFKTLLPLNVCAQKHDYNWVFGYGTPPSPFGNVILNFNENPVRIDTPNLNMEFESCTGVFSDSLGNLLLYTNGDKIFNQNFGLMQNGDSLNVGGLGVTESFSPMMFYLPGGDPLVYIVHTNFGYNNQLIIKQLMFTVVNTALNGGLGKVIAKNQIVLQGDLILPCAVKHGNGRDWWIMIAKRSDPNQYSFLLSPEGITGPFIQPILLPFQAEEQIASCNFSPDGNLYIRAVSNFPGISYSRLFDFDRCTGLLSNLREIYHEPGINPWKVEFSPNGKYIYFGRPSRLWSYDIDVANINDTEHKVAYWEFNYYPTYPWATGYHSLQRAPGGRIFVDCFTGSTQAYNVMHEPDLYGDACNFEEEAIHLPRWIDGASNIYFPDYRLGKWLDSPCDTLSSGGKPGFRDISYNPEEIEAQKELSLLQMEASEEFKALHPIIPGASKESSIDSAEPKTPMDLIYQRIKAKEEKKKNIDLGDKRIKHQ